ncbi:MAG: hypothetical protein EON59_05455 [Alphaproteobacteria bacterium]|nr:MAG: hypothetical protein EON59_05455 [Alphaproteobacteria bacterium]
MEDTESLSLTQTLTGRLRNFPLAPSPDNALYGVYEAVSNGLHAIFDRTVQAPPGEVRVEVLRAENGDVSGFVVSDNGVGLNEANFTSFKKLDSTYKAVRGGKGVGRLAQLKTFERVSISSRYHDEASAQLMERKFVFTDNDDTPIQSYSRAPTAAPIGTDIVFEGFRNAYQRECPKRPETIRRALIRHFLKDVISPDGARIVVVDDEALDLHEVFGASVSDRGESAFKVKINGSEQDFRVTHLIASKAFADVESNENTIYLLAHGRVVAKRPIGGLIGLKKLQGGRTYIGLVESGHLDDLVTQERTMLSAASELVDAILRAAGDKAVEFLKSETAPLRARQLQMVQQIKREYPRFMGVLSEESKFVEEKLQLSVRDQESVFRAVSLEWYRNKRRVDRSVRSAMSNPKNDEEFKRAVTEATSSIASESKAILADFVAERKVVIDFLEKLVSKNRATENYELESKLHDLVIPRKAHSDNIKWETHNLWLIDERLPYYYYFNSDRRLSDQVDNGSGRRPDITLSDVASAFQTRGNGEPFIIVEFKRPGRTTYTAEEDPVRQCIDYVKEMRDGKKAVDSKGAWISTIDENTLFYCYIVADLTPQLSSLALYHDLKKTPDGRGYFRFHDSMKAWIEIIPYDKLIESNRVRHNSFFEKLGIG